MVLVAALLAGAIGAAGPTPAQPNDDIDALNRQVDELFEAARFADAVPLAQRSVALTRARHGEDDPRFALALTNLAGLLQATNRLAEAEPSFRRALIAGHSPSTRRASGLAIPVSPRTSTTWPCCCRTPTALPRLSRSIAARLPSSRRASVQTTPTWLQTSTTWPSYCE
jgi:tetratricopeptide (TPR) repeat protein